MLFLQDEEEIFLNSFVFDLFFEKKVSKFLYNRFREEFVLISG